MEKRTILLLVFSLLSSPSVAEIKTLRFAGDDRPIILLQKFGFALRGRVNISVSDVSFTSSLAPPDPSLLGFFLISDDSLVQAVYESEQHQRDPGPNNGAAGFCILSSPYVRRLLSFRDLSRPPSNSFAGSFPITRPAEYSLFFASCAPECRVSMTVVTAMYNPGPDYLPVGLSRLPAIYSAFALAYAAFLGLWLYLCLVKMRPFAHRIHHLMGVLLLTKALNLLFAAEDQRYIQATGTPHGWDVLFYFFQFLKGLLLFTVIVLIGTGWSFLKPFLQEREKKVLMAVVPLQVLANVASAVIGENGPSVQDWMTWKLVCLVVDIVCCCAVMLPIIWSIRALREASKTDGKAARNLAKLTLFRQFYAVVIGYLYFTRIVVFALEVIVLYEYRWVSVVASEAASLAFYSFMFYMVRPMERNKYIAIDDDEEEAAQLALRQDDFEL